MQNKQIDKFNDKILKNKDRDVFIIFYNEWCGFSRRALDLLREKNLSFKGYQVDKIKGKMPRLLDSLISKKNLTNFDENHKTVPIIFKGGNFIGGYEDLVRYLDK